MNYDINSLFKFHPLTSWKEVNLDWEASKTFNISHDDSSPLLDSTFCEAWIDYITRRKDVEYTWGGYLENRGFLWRGSYLKPEHAIHLGLDFNVPSDTSVFCPVPFVLRDIFRDPDINGGWGDRLIVETKKGLVIFAHLRLPYKHEFVVGENYNAGRLLGTIAHPDHNGGWYPHLHVQGLRDISLLENLDGYSKDYEGIKLDYPNPLPFLT